MQQEEGRLMMLLLSHHEGTENERTDNEAVSVGISVAFNLDNKYFLSPSNADVIYEKVPLSLGNPSILKNVTFLTFSGWAEKKRDPSSLSSFSGGRNSTAFLRSQFRVRLIIISSLLLLSIFLLTFPSFSLLFWGLPVFNRDQMLRPEAHRVSRFLENF